MSRVERVRWGHDPLRTWIPRLLRPGPSVGIGVVFVVSLLGAATVTSLVGIPLPTAHDEFSYLLAADTYARGRLANPTPPSWQHFESEHILLRPTYASKYQPMQGMMLAIGQRLGHPVVGVWLSTALLSAAVMWMLLAWLPSRWAFIGGLLTALQFGMAGAWAQGYWGGAVPATGGALLWGAFRRLDRSPSWKAAAALGIGALVLALSRPFEGLVAFLIVLGGLALRRLRRRGGVGFGRAVTASLLAGLLLLALQGSYDSAVTGDPMVTPYQVHSAQYDAAPLFTFLPPRPVPEYHHDRLKRFHTEWELGFYQAQQTVRGWLVFFVARPVLAIVSFGLGPEKTAFPGTRPPGLMLLPLLLLPPLFRRRWSVYSLGVVALLFLALSTETYLSSRYLAVVTGLWMFLVVESLRIVRSLLRKWRFRRWVVPLALAYSMVLVGIVAAQSRAHFSDPGLWAVQRAQLTKTLSESGGRHLVLVDYSEDYSLLWEWVYNSAALDEQTVIWARYMDEAQNRELARAFPDREIWYLRVEPEKPPAVVRYAPSSTDR